MSVADSAVSRKFSFFPKDSLIEISISARNLIAPEEEKIRKFFRSLGFLDREIALLSRKGNMRLAAYTQSRRLAEKARERFKAFRERAWRLACRRLRPSEWRDKWKNDYRIQRLGARLVLVPDGLRKKYAGRPSRAVFLDPRSSFGTGTHETTRLAVRLMEKLAEKFRSFLDVGTGTGILGVAAHRLGAGVVTAVDKDPACIPTAKANLTANGCRGARVLARNITRWKKAPAADLVAANLSSDLLVRSSEALARSVKKAGYLIVSGIGRENRLEFCRRFRPPGLRRVRGVAGRKWAAFLYRRET